jgi:hypothetical protein
MMRSVLPLGFLLALYASANAATIHRSRPLRSHLLTHERAAVHPAQRASAPVRFAVPGWTDDQAQYWLDNATASAGLG